MIGTILQTFALFSFLLFTIKVEAESPPMERGFETPEAAFGAYRKAFNAVDHRACFSCMTTRAQVADLTDLVFAALPLTNESAPLRQVLEKHGLDPEQLRRLGERLSDVVDTAPEYNEQVDSIWRDTSRHLSSQATDSAALYADLLAFNNQTTLTIQDADRLSSSGTLAIGKATQTHVVTILVGEPAAPKQQMITSERQFFFRRVDGRWLLDMSDDAAKYYDRLLPQE